MSLWQELRILLGRAQVKKLRLRVYTTSPDLDFMLQNSYVPLHPSAPLGLSHQLELQFALLAHFAPVPCFAPHSPQVH